MGTSQRWQFASVRSIIKHRERLIPELGRPWGRVNIGSDVVHRSPRRGGFRGGRHGRRRCTRLACVAPRHIPKVEVLGKVECVDRFIERILRSVRDAEYINYIRFKGEQPEAQWTIRQKVHTPELSMRDTSLESTLAETGEGRGGKVVGRTLLFC